jgi:hypothetical protein
MKSADQPHAKRLKRRGCLKNGNPPGDPSDAPRCGARTRNGTPCMGSAMTNGRCRMHGGRSTGPRTPQGLARSRKARWKHGRYSLRARAEQQYIRMLLREGRSIVKEMLHS